MQHFRHASLPGFISIYVSSSSSFPDRARLCFVLSTSPRYSLGTICVHVYLSSLYLHLTFTSSGIAFFHSID
ncbi:hypothetical protein BO71DRAFT_90297 [Aspergillus ellipticus CBS 707.79]|uniref:Uncharacterized protein n=1 Tax=Aspergillus ellipticus CBS 707.79 TaxID=1448320 RepID=A0A319CYM7_9EURO|nr:hypothetical protein BO71DRAFT_90297 [Aspergillus ellipticus CBS 707.79]